MANTMFRGGSCILDIKYEYDEHLFWNPSIPYQEFINIELLHLAHQELKYYNAVYCREFPRNE